MFQIQSRVAQTTGYWRHVAALFRIPLALLASALAYGTAGFVVIEGWSLLDAVYMSVMTLTTVGYREVHPLGVSGRIFAITLMLIGVVILFVAVGAVAQLVLSGELGEPLRRRRMQRRIDALKDHYIICAYGRVGRAAASELRQQGAPYVIVEPQESLVPLMEEHKAPYLVADPTEAEVLVQAGIDRAKGLVCAVDSDASNVYITLTARNLNPNLSIAARSSAPESVDQLHRAGADRVVSPYVLSGKRMASMVVQPAVVEFIDMVAVAPDLRLEEFVVGPRSMLDDKTVGEVEAEHSELTILAVQKPGAELIPSPDPSLRLSADDLVVALGPVQVLGSLARSP